MAMIFPLNYEYICARGANLQLLSSFSHGCNNKIEKSKEKEGEILCVAPALCLTKFTPHLEQKWQEEEWQ